MRKLLLILLLVFNIFTPTTTSLASQEGPVLLIIDSSGSMKGEKINAVKDSVKQIISSLQRDQSLGIISFNEKVSVLLSPTIERREALSKIDSLSADGDTSMYDALLKALELQIQPIPRQIVLLSDGADTTSKTSLNSLLDKIKISGIPINTIGVKVSNEQKVVLNNISNQSLGSFYDVTDISALIQTYSTILENELVDNESNSMFPDTPTTNQENLGTNIYFEIFVSLMASFLFYLILIEFRRKIIKQRNERNRKFILRKYSESSLRKIPSKLKKSLESYSFVPRRIEIKVKEKLELIHSDLKYTFIIRILLITMLVLSLFFSFLLQNIILGFILGVCVTPLLFNSYINNVRSKQITKFAEELPELLNILASALKAGLTLPQGLEAYSTDSKGEVARQIRRAIGEIRVGTPIDEALMGIAERMESEDLKWAVTALSIQRIVGGSMATILTTTYETVKGRSEIRREVRTLAAEGKLSAYVLIALPIGIFGFLALTRREYVSTFWTTPGGIFLSFIVISSMFIGWIWMKKIVDIKI